MTLAVGALVIAGTGALAAAGPAQAGYAPRVVIVVGPAGGSTGDYLSHARDYAAQARSYGAAVTTVFHPHATWARVVAAAQGANVFIYLGHGNGWPSPYAPYQQLTKDGLGLDPFDGAGAGNVKYYGEAFVRAHLRFAPGAVVLLNRLCYASGAAEPGMANPAWSTAVKRVDNYAAGFLAAGARVVLADGHTSLRYELAVLFGRAQPVTGAWSADPDANGNARGFASDRTPGARLRLDPDRTSAGFYRSLVVRSGTPTTGAIRVAATWGRARAATTLRARPSTAATVVGTLRKDARYVVRGPLSTDSAGRTWAPVMTRGGRQAWVAAWTQAFAGSIRARTGVVLRTRPSTRAGRDGLVRAGVRVTILGSARDGADRAWLKVRTPGGRTGWIAGWLAAP